MAASWIADAQLSMKHQGSGQWTDEQLFASYALARLKGGYHHLGKSVAFHGNTVYQAMLAPVPITGLVGREARCNNDQCDLRERCQRWLSREDPWRHEAPRWRHGGETCDWKLLLPEDAPPTI